MEGERQAERKDREFAVRFLEFLVSNFYIPRYLNSFLGLLASILTDCSAQCRLMFTLRPAKRKNSIMSATS
jgi:hypothetical protein